MTITNTAIPAGTYTITVRGLLDAAIQKFGEKVEILRFERLSVR